MARWGIGTEHSRCAGRIPEQRAATRASRRPGAGLTRHKQENVISVGTNDLQPDPQDRLLTSLSSCAAHDNGMECRSIVDDEPDAVAGKAATATIAIGTRSHSPP
jgi:hypothetical protein